MPDIIEILERTQTGEYCTQRDWDVKRIPQTIRGLLKKHGLENLCDQETPVNTGLRPLSSSSVLAGTAHGSGRALLPTSIQ